MYETILLGLKAVITDPATILCLVLGTLGGMVFGAIPGLTGALGVTLMLPFTFSMPPTMGLAMLIGIYVGGVSGGLVASIMLNIPGNAAAIVTCFDGAPMARQGKPFQALSYGITASLIGGLFSAVALIVLAPILARVGLKFGSWEYFAMGMMGMSIVVRLCSEDLVKGLIGAILGIMLAMVGYDRLSIIPRFTFGFWQLGSGLESLATLMGLFAFGEILVQVNNLGQKNQKVEAEAHSSVLPTRAMFQGLGKTISVSAILGTFIGILPGVGQNTAALLAYNQARSSSKTPEKFGTGCPEGIVAPEVANNAVCGGALIPMMTLGIPGDMITSVLMSGLIVHGMAPGPQLFQFNADIVGSIYISYILACIVMYLLFVLLMKYFIRVLSLPMNYLFPVILVMCVIGTYTTNSRLFDVGIFICMGTLGYVLTRLKVPLAPIVLGFVLGPIVEINFRTALIAHKGSLLSVFTQPIATCLLALAVLMLAFPPLLKLVKAKRAAREA